MKVRLLPLDPATAGKVLVVGTHGRDTPIGGYSDVPRQVVSILEGLRKAAGNQFRSSLPKAFD